MVPHHVIRFTCHHRTLKAAMDVELLRSILTNIVQNAIRYSPDNGVIATIKILSPKNYITFRISD